VQRNTNILEDDSETLPLIQFKKRPSGLVSPHSRDIRVFMNPIEGTKDLPSKIKKYANLSTTVNSPKISHVPSQTNICPEQGTQENSETDMIKLYAKIKKNANKRSVLRNKLKRIWYRKYMQNDNLLEIQKIINAKLRLPYYFVDIDNIRENIRLRRCASLDSFVRLRITIFETEIEKPKIQINTKIKLSSKNIKRKSIDTSRITNSKDVSQNRISCDANNQKKSARKPMNSARKSTFCQDINPVKSQREIINRKLEKIYRDDEKILIKAEYYSRVHKRESLKQLKNSFRYEPQHDFCNDQFVTMEFLGKYQIKIMKLIYQEFKKSDLNCEYLPPLYNNGIVLWLRQLFMTDKKELKIKINQIKLKIPVDQLFKYGDQLPDKEIYEKMLQAEQDKKIKDSDISKLWYNEANRETFLFKKFDKLPLKLTDSFIQQNPKPKSQKPKSRRRLSIHENTSEIQKYQHEIQNTDIKYAELTDGEDNNVVYRPRQSTRRVSLIGNIDIPLYVDPRKDPTVLREIIREIIGGGNVKELFDRDHEDYYENDTSILIKNSYQNVLKTARVNLMKNTNSKDLYVARIPKIAARIKLDLKNINLTLKEQNLKAAIRPDPNFKPDENISKNFLNAIEKNNEQVKKMLVSGKIDTDVINILAEYGQKFTTHDKEILKVDREKEPLRITKEFRQECTKKMDNFGIYVEQEVYNQEAETFWKLSHETLSAQTMIKFETTREPNKSHILMQERIGYPYTFMGYEQVVDKVPFADDEARQKEQDEITKIKRSSSRNVLKQSESSDSDSESGSDNGQDYSEIREKYNPRKLLNCLRHDDLQDKLRQDLLFIQANHHPNANVFTSEDEKESIEEDGWLKSHPRRISTIGKPRDSVSRIAPLRLSNLFGDQPELKTPDKATEKLSPPVSIRVSSALETVRSNTNSDEEEEKDVIGELRKEPEVTPFNANENGPSPISLKLNLKRLQIPTIEISEHNDNSPNIMNTASGLRRSSQNNLESENFSEETEHPAILSIRSDVASPKNNNSTPKSNISQRDNKNSAANFNIDKTKLYVPSSPTFANRIPQPAHSSTSKLPRTPMGRLETLQEKRKNVPVSLTRSGSFANKKRLSFSQVPAIVDRKSLKVIKKMYRRMSSSSQGIHIDASGKLFKAVHEMRYNEVFLYFLVFHRLKHF